MLQLNSIHCADCLEKMKEIDDKSIDLILADLPYGTTACSWDTIIPFEPLWEQYKRIIKDNGAIVLTASQPFTSVLVMSNVKMFKYEWIWKKNKPSGMATSKYMPMKEHESILVFGKGKIKYNPLKELTKSKTSLKHAEMGYINKGNFTSDINNIKATQNKWNKFVNPRSVLEIDVEHHRIGRLHPTQKPVALFEYLIKTYTNEGDLVLDNCIGSGTTAVACKNLNRNFIGIELEQKYVDIANKRLINLSLQGESL